MGFLPPPTSPVPQFPVAVAKPTHGCCPATGVPAFGSVAGAAGSGSAPGRRHSASQGYVAGAVPNRPRSPEQSRSESGKGPGDGCAMVLWYGAVFDSRFSLAVVNVDTSLLRGGECGYAIF